jgi:hypothetical protein
MWPHKNHQLLLLALHRLRQLYGVQLQLVLTGDDLGQWKTLQEIAKHFQLQSKSIISVCRGRGANSVAPVL